MTILYGAKGTDGRLLSRPLLQAAAARTWGWQTLPPIRRSPRGKPFFQNLPQRCFSISHSGGYALCALSRQPVGVDIELVAPHRAGLPEYCLSQEELALFDGSWEQFTQLWTLKESWCKQEDAPLFPPRLVSTPPPCPHRCYQGSGWRAALCCHDLPPEQILWLEQF